MLIYRNDGKLFCVSQKALKLAGYRDIAEFMAEHEDYSELFVKQPGYIYKFENFSWIAFLRNATLDQKKVLIATRDNATYECELSLEMVYPVAFEADTPEFYYQIEFKNLHLYNPSAASGDQAEFITGLGSGKSVDFAALSSQEEYSAPAQDFGLQEVSEVEEPQKTVAFAANEEKMETPAEESPEMILFDTLEEPEKASEKHEEALDLVDFSFDDSSTAEPEITLKEEPAATQKPETPFNLDIKEAKSGEKETLSAEPEIETDEISAAFESAVPTPSPQSEHETPEIGLKEETVHPFVPSTSLDKQLPDAAKVAATLGLPQTMVVAFIKEFIQTYVQDRPELEAAMEAGLVHVVKNEATKLKGISSNLMMEPLTISLEEVNESDSIEDLRHRWEMVESYMRELASHYLPNAFTPPSATVETLESMEVVKAVQEPQEKDEEEAASTKKREPLTESPNFTVSSSETPKKLVLEEVAGNENFEFDPAEAANALGLPESLIVEFVGDFIEQAREERPHFEEAYEAGDIKTINEIAHKLKGVAANLRIEQMRELMESVQHSQSLEEVEERLVAFYRKLAALSNTMAKEYA